jgi:putative addiction module component (TIGR02574 family)
MPKTLSEVTRDAAGLPEPERLKLARTLLELSEPGTESPADLQEAWDEEIEQRLRELRSGEVKGVPLEEVKRRIESRFHRED